MCARKCMMTNMKTVLHIGESRESPNDPGGLTTEWGFNGDNCDMEIRRQQRSLVVMI